MLNSLKFLSKNLFNIWISKFIHVLSKKKFLRPTLEHLYTCYFLPIPEHFLVRIHSKTNLKYLDNRSAHPVLSNVYSIVQGQHALN